MSDPPKKASPVLRVLQRLGVESSVERMCIVGDALDAAEVRGRYAVARQVLKHPALCRPADMQSMQCGCGEPSYVEGGLCKHCEALMRELVKILEL